MEFDDLNQSLGAFEGALSGNKIDITHVSAKRILLALDGSNQDTTATQLTRAFARAQGAKVYVMRGSDAELGPEDRDQPTRVAAELKAAPGPVEAEALTVSAPGPGQQILSAALRCQAELIVAPAPYLRDVGLLGDESLSSPIDVLLAESTIPVLLVRHPLPEPAACFERMLLPLTVHLGGLGKVASWAFCALSKGGQVELHAVADERALGEALAIVGAGGERALGSELLRAEERHVGAVIAALQKHATKSGASVVAEVEVGRAHKRLLEHVHARPCLVVVGLPTERAQPAYHFAIDLALGSRYPVLLVPRVS